jgi:hypothetical protein
MAGVAPRWLAARAAVAAALRRLWAGAVRAALSSTGVGDPALEQLRKDASNYEGYQVTAPSKRKLLEGLAVAIQQGQVRYPDGAQARADKTDTSGVVDRRGRLAPIAKVKADRAAQQHRLHRQDNLQPLHDLRPALPKDGTSVGQYNG